MRSDDLPDDVIPLSALAEASGYDAAELARMFEATPDDMPSTLRANTRLYIYADEARAWLADLSRAG